MKNRHPAAALRGAFAVTKYELYMVFFSAKFWIFLLLTWGMMGFLLTDVVRFAQDYNLEIFPAGLIFFYSCEITCNAGFLIFILLIGDAPFRENNQVYLLERCGRKGLCIGQLLSLCVISVVFTFLQFLISVLQILPNITVSEWGKVWGSVAEGYKLSELGYVIYGVMPQEAVTDYGPWQAVGITFLLVSLLGMCYAMVLYLLNNIGSGKAGTVVVGAWNVAWILLSVFSENLLIRKLMYLSPQHWLSLSYIEPSELPGKCIKTILVIAGLAAVNILVEIHPCRRCF